MHEDSTKMSVNGLAIIFAPCLLRSNKKIQAQESLNQVPKQTRWAQHAPVRHAFTHHAPAHTHKVKQTFFVQFVNPLKTNGSGLHFMFSDDLISVV